MFDCRYIPIHSWIGVGERHILLIARQNKWFGNFSLKCQVGVVVITRASHLYIRPGIDPPSPHVGRALSISIWLRGFFSGYLGFPPSLTLCSEVMHGPYSGSQRRLYMLSVRPRWAGLPLYFEAVMSTNLSFFLFCYVLNVIRRIWCTRFLCVSKIWASIFDIQVNRVNEKIISPANCYCICKICMQFTLVTNDVALATICQFMIICPNVTK